MTEGVALRMEDHSAEDYVPPQQPRVRAFGGSGQTLGSERTPQVVQDVLS